MSWRAPLLLLFIVGVRGGGGLENFSPLKGGPLDKQHAPTKGGRDAPWGPPTTMHDRIRARPQGPPPPFHQHVSMLNVGAFPHVRGGPPQPAPIKRGWPPKWRRPHKPAQNSPPWISGMLVPHPAGTMCFFRARYLRKIPEGSWNFSGTLQNILDAFQNFLAWRFAPKHFRLWWFYSETFFGISETFPVFSPEHFRCLR